MGAGEFSVEVGESASIASALAAARTELADTDRAAFDSVIARCSFLVNEIATSDPGDPLVGGDRVDVLPPFAGG